MLEKLRELNEEILKKIKNFDFEIKYPTIEVKEAKTTLSCEIIIADMRFCFYTNNVNNYVTAWYSNINLPPMKEEDKKEFLQHVWLESSRIVKEMDDEKQKAIQEVIKKIA